MLSNIIKHSLGIPTQKNKAGGRNKKDTNGKEEVKLSLFADDVILYKKDLRTSTKKLLDTTNNFSKVEHKINLQKSVILLHPNNKQRKNIGK
jgi:hypothetical protein